MFSDITQLDRVPSQALGDVTGSNPVIGTRVV